MEINNFLTQETLVTFAMTIFIVELWVSFSKEIKFIKNIPTKLYTFMLSMTHLILINSTANIFEKSILGFYVLSSNALVISMLLCGSYDLIKGNTIIKNKKGKEDESR